MTAGRSPGLPALLIFVLLTLLGAGIVALMCRVRILDRPDARKLHDRPTPKGGGVGVVVVVLLGMRLFGGWHAEMAAMLVGGVLLALVALGDDVREMGFRWKLAAQLLAAALVVGVGGYGRVISIPVLGAVPLGLAGMALVLGWILVVTNAVNFIDGMNGLAAGYAAIACLALLGIAWRGGDALLAAGAGALLAGLLGFLPFNYPRARIFLGDVGSQFIGFTLAVLCLRAGAAPDAPRIAGAVPSLTGGAVLLGGILADVLLTLLRRWREGRAISQPHRDHAYQRAADLGLPRPVITLVYWGFAAAGGIAALFMAGTLSGWRVALGLAALAPPIAWYAVINRRWRARGTLSMDGRRA